MRNNLIDMLKYSTFSFTFNKFYNDKKRKKKDNVLHI